QPDPDLPDPELDAARTRCYRPTRRRSAHGRAHGAPDLPALDLRRARQIAGVILALFSAVTWLTGFVLAGPLTLAAQRPSDDQIRKSLIGSWIIAPDGSAPLNALEVFRDDGTYTFFVYADASCKNIVHEIDVKWIVADGMLITIYPSKHTLRDE